MKRRKSSTKGKGENSSKNKDKSSPKTFKKTLKGRGKDMAAKITFLHYGC